jgi:hypothetical protein
VVSDLQDRLTKIAERGTPRGFDDVFTEASKRADTLDVVPMVEDITPRERKPRRPYMSLVAAAGVTSLLLVGMLAISALVGNGGASSPEAAVRQLADAVSHEDPLQAADVLAPNEVRSLHGTLSDAAKKAKELALVDAASAPLTGIDFSVDNLSLTTTNLGDGYAKVTVDRGSLSATTSREKFSALMQKVLREGGDNSAQVDLAQLVQDRSLPTFVIAVKDGGSWYVSAAYTALEYFREYNNLPAADFGSGVKAAATLGADSPDAAVQDAMHALQAGDWEKLMALAPPDEVPVYDYRAAISQYATQHNASTNFTISSMTTSSKVDGDTAKVALTAAGSTDSGDWSVRDGCFKPSDTPVAYVGILSSADGCLPAAYTMTFGGAGATTNAISVVQQHGRWFVSPVHTALDVLDNYIQKVDRRGLDTLLNLPGEIPSDGTLTLGQPVVISPSEPGLHVFKFHGTKGERLLGQADDGTKNPDYPMADAEVFSPDGGSETGSMVYGTAVTIAADGDYLVVMRSFSTKDVSVTVWDAADAPEAAKHPVYGSSGDGCQTDINGISSCFSSSSGILGGESDSSSATSTPDETTPCVTVAPKPGDNFACASQPLG